ncbi:tyrosine--tRNA ligase [soil metagenome]
MGAHGLAGGLEGPSELTSGAAEIVPVDALTDRLASGRPLRVKLGIDPSRPDLTLGHTVVLRKLRQFQDAGHVGVLIVGDFTGRVGDPSGRSSTRPMLTPDQIDANAATYLEQASLVIDVTRAELRRNSEWLAGLDMAELIRLASVATVAQMLERGDFQERFRAGRPISVVEFLYPLLQGYDSVSVEADIELGGTDQTFNLLMGREVQRAYAQPPQVVLTMPLLEGTDGVRKMSKSLDNYVALTEPAEEQFGKLMSIADHLIVKYRRLCTPMSAHDVESLEQGLAEGSLRTNEEKRAMARAIVDLYHGPGAGAEAEARFDLIHKQHEVPTDVVEVAMPDDAIRDGRVWLPRLLVATGLAASNGEARRSVQGGGVRLGPEVLEDPDAELEVDAVRGEVLSVGRRRFVRIV